MLNETRDYLGYGYRCHRCCATFPVDQLRISAQFHCNSRGNDAMHIFLPSLTDLRKRDAIVRATCPSCYQQMELVDLAIEGAKDLARCVLHATDAEDGVQIEVAFTDSFIARGHKPVYPAIEFPCPAPISVSTYLEEDKPSELVMKDRKYFMGIAIRTMQHMKITDGISRTSYEAERLSIMPDSCLIPEYITEDASDATVEDFEMLMRSIFIRMVLLAVRGYIKTNHISANSDTVNRILDLQRYCCGIEGNLLHNFEMRRILNIR